MESFKQFWEKKFEDTMWDLMVSKSGIKGPWEKANKKPMSKKELESMMDSFRKNKPKVILKPEIVESVDLHEKKIKGITSTENKHHHEYVADGEGDGKTTSTMPKGFPDDHVHDIKSAEVIAAGKKKHTHSLKTAK
jgi:radical SAM superfamily enzyme with C-terminal helix-hairpin-helix motif